MIRRSFLALLGIARPCRGTHGIAGGNALGWLP